MGKAASVEAQRKRSKGSQRLSKPLIGNPATAGLLNPNGQSDIIYQPPSATARRFSSSYGSASATSPCHLGTESTMADDSVAPGGVSALEDYLSNSMFQYNHPHVSNDARELEDCSPHLFQYNASSEGVSRQRSQSVGVVASSSRDRRTHRTISSHIGAGEDYEPPQLGFTVPQRNASRSSVKYDLSSYDPRRLLNFVEEPPFEDQLTGSESLFQLPLSRRQSHTTSYHPAQSDAAVPIPHTDSDLSLYAPIRRRSLLTPGVATRPAPADFVIPPAVEIRNNHSSTPARCDSPESRGIEFGPIRRSPGDPSLVPRAHTPCEADYKQTGAFKHGTLRITNGSPAVAPAWETTDDGLCSNGSSTPIKEKNNIDTNDQVIEKQKMPSNDNQYLIPPSLISVSPIALAKDSTVGTSEQNTTSYFLPELELAMTPFSLAPITGLEPVSQGSQAVNKLTDVKHQLFEDKSPEYYAELLNIRFDDTKPRSCSPGSLGERRQKEDTNRSDSGVMASPASEVAPQLLSKADSGYSSSVSMRSLSLKRDCQPEIENPLNVGEASAQIHTSLHEKLSGDTSVLANSAAVSPKEQLQAPSPVVKNELPPPVPKKDNLTQIPKEAAAESTDSQAPVGKVCPLPDGTPVSETSESSHYSALGRNSPSTATSSSGTGKARKPGLLKRLLSGARIPMTGHIIHDPGGEIDSPSIPREAQKPHEHVELPDSSENHTAIADARIDRSEPATATGTTTAINNRYSSMDQASQDPSVSGRTGQDQTRRPKSSFRLDSISSTITRAASSVMAKNPIRKPTLSRTKQTSQGTTSPASDTPAETPQHSRNTSRRRREVEERIDSGSINPANERKHAGGPAVNTGRSNSLSVSVGSRNPRIYNDALRSHLASQNEQHRIASRRRASITGQYSVSGTPPPVSMMTRNMGNMGQFRVPPPIRPHSTPRLQPPTFSRKQSRDGVPSHLYSYAPDANNATSSRRSSRDSVYANPTAQIQAFSNAPSQAPGVATMRRSSDQSRLAEYQFSVGNIISGAVSSREPSFDHSRRNSLASQTSQRSVVGNRPPWPQSPAYDRPVLRHRSSYDGYHIHTRQGYRQENGPYASLPLANGQMFVPDPLSVQPMFQQPRPHQQHGGLPSRGHVQHYSLDQYGSPVQYRALHSYNSSGYRGMPVRSG
ncbi:hypothetical protein F4861DRAFT_549532 [Xylaria intraflava]|nr:hypothetical protein F4861DRAFT_549532 [Xylaria intraflava]